MEGSYAILLADVFPTNVRFSGVGLSLSLTTVIFTGVTPLLVTHLMRITGENTAPGLYLPPVALLFLVAGRAPKRCGGWLPASKQGALAAA